MKKIYVYGPCVRTIMRTLIKNLGPRRVQEKSDFSLQIIDWKKNMTNVREAIEEMGFKLDMTNSKRPRSRNSLEGSYEKYVKPYSRALKYECK